MGGALDSIRSTVSGASDTNTAWKREILEGRGTHASGDGGELARFPGVEREQTTGPIYANGITAHDIPGGSR